LLQGSRVVDLLSLACNGDVSGLQRMSIRGQDMSIVDYDGRTALHLASCEGHLNCVRFLVEKCGVRLEPKDRWGHTPYDDSVRFQKPAVESYLHDLLFPKSTGGTE